MNHDPQFTVVQASVSSVLRFCDLWINASESATWPAATCRTLLHVGHPLALGHRRELNLLALLQLEWTHIADCRAGPDKSGTRLDGTQTDIREIETTPLAAACSEN